MAPPAADGAPKGTARRDKLHELEEKAQAKWDKANAFEVDAPEGKWDGGKFMATFPYPYMNGLLHIGHGFSCSKAEFAVAFQRLQGKKAIFPFAFHCTGMPIQAAAVKLKKEYDLYGSPVPNFPPSPPEVVELDAELGSITIGWKLPTSTGGKPLSACRVLLRTGPAEAEFVEIAKLPAAEAGPGGQCSFCASGLTVGTNYSFKVVSVVEGLPGVESKTLEKSADGKHALALMAPKDDGKKGGGGGGGKKAAKTKTVAKTGGMMTQWDILRSMGLAIEDIPPFVDPTYWLRYFPPLGKQDLKRFGCGIDWRRTFITTDYNAYYDSFVRWQFYKLREVRRGSRAQTAPMPQMRAASPSATRPPCRGRPTWSPSASGPPSIRRPTASRAWTTTATRARASATRSTPPSRSRCSRRCPPCSRRSRARRSTASPARSALRPCAPPPPPKSNLRTRSCAALPRRLGS